MLGVCTQSPWGCPFHLLWTNHCSIRQLHDGSMGEWRGRGGGLVDLAWRSPPPLLQPVLFVAVYMLCLNWAPVSAILLVCNSTSISSASL